MWFYKSNKNLKIYYLGKHFGFLRESSLKLELKNVFCVCPCPLLTHQNRIFVWYKMPVYKKKVGMEADGE